MHLKTGTKQNNECPRIFQRSTLNNAFMGDRKVTFWGFPPLFFLLKKRSKICIELYNCPWSNHLSLFVWDYRNNQKCRILDTSSCLMFLCVCVCVLFCFVQESVTRSKSVWWIEDLKDIQLAYLNVPPL